MDGLKGANTKIGDDGTTVIVKTESEHTARELAAQLETQVRAKEGGPGAKFNSWLKKSLDRFDETLGIYGDRALNIIRDVLLICAMALAAFAWYRVLPGYEILMCIVGMAIVFTIKTCAGRLDAAWREDKGLFAFFSIIIAFGLIIEVMASSSLQAFTAVEQETGRADVDLQIDALSKEQSRLNIALLQPSPGSPAELEALIQGYRATPMVSSTGSQLTKTVGMMVDETGCAGRSYYVGIYCPDYLDLKGKLEAAKVYEADKERFSAIGPQIAALQAQRPHTSSTFALASKASGGGTAWWLSLVIPVGLTLMLNLTMLTIAYLAGRAKRTPPLELTQTVPPGGAAT